MAGSSERRLGVGGGSGSPPKRAAVSAAAEVDGAPARLRMPARRPRSSSAVVGSSLASVSRMTQARWPSSVAGGALGLVAEGRFGRRAIDDGQRPVGPREGLLDVRLGVAHELAEERQGVDGDLRVAAAAPVDVGHRRDRRADEPALPARRAVDELLELGPAIGLGGDALGVRVGERVDGDPVAGLARGAAEELPGPLGLASSVRSSRPKANQRASSSVSWKSRSAMNRSGVGRSPRVALRKPRWTAAISGQRTPWTAPIPGATRCWPSRYSGSARPARPLVSAVGEAVRVVGELGEVGAEGLGGVAVGGHERDGVGRGLAADRGRRSRVRPSTGSGGPGSTVAAAPVSGAVGRAVGVALAEVALLVRAGRDVDAGRGRELDAGRGIDDVAGRVDDPPASVGDPALGADRQPRP